MTRAFPDAPGPGVAVCTHPCGRLLPEYAAATLDEAVAWSVEAHLTGCAHCRSALTAYVEPERLARNRSVLLVRAALPDGRVSRLLRRCGVPDYLLRLLAATPSLRLSWLLAIVGVLAVVTGESLLTSAGVGGLTSLSVSRGEAVLVPFILVAPLLVLAAVAAAFLPMFDPAYQLAVAAPFSGFTLLLVRAVSALATALVPVVCAAFAMPGPGWLPAMLLLPSLALCAFALAAATLMPPLTAAVVSGGLWILPALLLAASHLPLAILQWNAQSACAAAITVSAVVLFMRHDRFERGLTR
jgi:Putative zinc-finger